MAERKRLHPQLQEKKSRVHKIASIKLRYSVRHLVILHIWDIIFGKVERFTVVPNAVILRGRASGWMEPSSTLM